MKKEGAMTKRVLIVEDDPEIVRHYRRMLLDYPTLDVESALDPVTAMNRLNDRSFHVVTADIMMAGDNPEDTRGMDVIHHIRQLNEGTKVIIASGFGKPDAGQAAINEWAEIVSRYFKKSDPNFIADFPKAVLDVANAAVIKPFGRFGHLNAYLGRPQLRDEWIGDLGSYFGLPFRDLDRALASAFTPILPVLRLRDVASSLVRGTKRHTAGGLFWSKALGEPVYVAFAAQGVDIELPNHVTLKAALQDNSRGPLKSAVWSVDNVVRSQFFDSLSDVG